MDKKDYEITIDGTTATANCTDTTPLKIGFGLDASNTILVTRAYHLAIMELSAQVTTRVFEDNPDVEEVTVTTPYVLIAGDECVITTNATRPESGSEDNTISVGMIGGSVNPDLETILSMLVAVGGDVPPAAVADLKAASTSDGTDDSPVVSVPHDEPTD